MNREIKFRAWEIFTPKMVYDFVICQPRETIILNEYFVDMNSEAIEIPLHLINLMQYTGLKDCEGKEIYEGDILKINDKLWEVNWNYYRLGFGAHPLQASSMIEIEEIEENIFCHDCMKTHIEDDGFREEIEVVGNIYENPELLGASNEEKTNRNSMQ